MVDPSGLQPGDNDPLAGDGGCVGPVDAHLRHLGGELNREVIAQFCSARRASGMRWVSGAYRMDPVLDFLGEQGVLAVPETDSGPMEALVQRYRRWLVDERGLAEATIERYMKLARLFVTGQDLISDANARSHALRPRHPYR